MMHDLVSSPTRLRRDCGRLARGLAILCLVVSGLILLESFGPWLVRRPDGGEVVARLIALVAPAAYMAGLWGLGRGLKLFAGHGRFVTAVADALNGVGWALAAGGVFQVAVAPGLEALSGHGPGYWIGLDPAAFALAALGLALVVLARLFRRAARLEAELETLL